MTRPRSPRRAAVLAAALHSWTVATADTTPVGTQVVLREGPDWQWLATNPLTDSQVDRVIGFLRADLAVPGPTTAVQAGAAVDQILAEWRAEGRKTVRPADFVEALPRIGRSRSWLAHHLVHLVDSKYLPETRRPGVYRL